MNEAIQRRIERLSLDLHPGEVVAYKPSDGRVTIFTVTASRTPESIERWGWNVVKTYTLPDIKPFLPQADKAKPGRKPKPDAQ